MIPIPIVGAIAEAARTVLDRVLPDPTARAAAEVELRKLAAEGTFEQRAEQALALAQIEVNKAEAATDDYRGGWRPMVGWACAVAMAWQFVVRPMAAFGLAVAGHGPIELPEVDNHVWELLFSMLGLSFARSVEKLRGVA